MKPGYFSVAKSIACKILLVIFCCITISNFAKASSDSLFAAEKLIYGYVIKHVQNAEMMSRLDEEMKTSISYPRKVELQIQLDEMRAEDSTLKVNLDSRLISLRTGIQGFPVYLYNDTMFFLHGRSGSFKPAQRALTLNERIFHLYKKDLFDVQKLMVAPLETGADILYNDEVILNVSYFDAYFNNKTPVELAKQYRDKIVEAINHQRQLNSTTAIVKKAAFGLLILVCAIVLLWLINKLYNKSKHFVDSDTDSFLLRLVKTRIRLIRIELLHKSALQLLKLIRLVFVLVIIYVSLALVFSIFPATKTFASTLLRWVITPAKLVLDKSIEYLPNLFTIVVIFVITRYVIKVIAYFAKEIQNEVIKLPGFHSDWASPTFHIVRFLLYAFMFIVIFPYLPGSSSPAFQGVSVFLGILLSLGSSSAISNILAGLVITYMRPFRIGDRVKIGDVTGDVVEKSILVTRIRTIKNEDITVPNSTVLNSSTINYSSNAKETGLIMHTTVTIGYDVPWKNMHQALINAALRTQHIMKEPTPFVLQTALNDFYVSYEINCYTREANMQANIYAELHQNIQDCCNEAGIEIMSPHYSNLRDGNKTTIPQNYLKEDYKAPGFKIEKDS